MSAKQKGVSALLLLSSLGVLAKQPTAPDTSATATLDEIRVVGSSSALAGSALGVYQQISDNVVDKTRLQRQSATLGNALAGEVGVHSNPFGGGASAPIIRGQEGIRIKMLQNGLDVVDMSTISPDHAIAADSLLAQQIELVRGASTLRYATSSPAGVLNVVDKRIPTQIPEKGYEGEIHTRLDSASQGKIATFGVTTQLARQLALRIEGLKRHAENYRVRQFNVGERVNNVPDTYNQSTVGTVGLSWIGDKGYLGAAYSHRKDRYGLPGHNHKFDDCRGHIIDARQHSVIPRNYLVPYPHLAETADVIDFPHFDGCSSDHDQDPSHSHEHPYGQQHIHRPDEIGPWVELTSRRVDIRSELKVATPLIDKIQASFAYADYRHAEIDSGRAGISLTDLAFWKEIKRKKALQNYGKAAGIFTNRGYNAKLELHHRPFGSLTGLWGVQYSAYRTRVESTYNNGISNRYPLIPNTNKIVSLFGIENYVIGDVILEAGARFEKQRLPIQYDPAILATYVKPGDAKPDLSPYKQHAFSYSLSADWWLNDRYRLAVIGSHNERLPTPMELYYQGKHLATNSFEYGNKELQKERSNNLELAFGYQSEKWDARLSAYYNRFKNYIYNEDLFREGNLFMRRYTQAEAKFHGLEGEIRFKPTADYTFALFGDYVRGKLFQLPEKYRRPTYSRYIDYDEEGLLTIYSQPKGEQITANPDRNAPRVPPARLGLRFNGQFTPTISGFIEYTYAFPQKKTAKSLSVREPKPLTHYDVDEESLLDGVDFNAYNPRQLDLSDEYILEEFTENLKTIRLDEKNEALPLHQKTIKEDRSKAYHLLNVGIDYRRHWKGIDYQVGLSVNNLLNQPIYTHTSYLPYVPQMGRNYALNLGVSF